MAKTGIWDFRTGSYNEKLSGTIPTLTNVLSRPTTKGLSLFSNNNASVDTNVLSSSLLGASGTIEVWFKSNPTLDGKPQYLVMTQRTTNGSSYLSLLINAAGKLQGYYLNNAGSVDTSSLVGTDTLVNDKLYHVMLVKDGATIRMYLDNVLIDTVADAGTAVGAYDAFFCSTHAGVNNLSGNILLVRFYNEAISELERNKNYAEFVNSQPISKPKRGFLMNKPNDLSKEVNNTVTNLNIPSISSTDWQGSNWVISTGSATITANGGDLYTVAPFMLGGRTYSYDITINISVGNVIIIDYNGTTLATLTNGRNVGTFTNSSFTSTRFFYIRASSGTTATISSVNVSLLSGLVAAYNMRPNGLTLTDISGNGYNGTITQGVTSTKDGIIMRQGATLTTTSIPLENDFSIAFRVKWLTASSISNFMRQAGSSTSNIWIYRIATNAMRIDQNAGGSNTTAKGSTGPIGSEETWVVTFNATTNIVTWYRNGAVITSTGTYNPSGSRTAVVNIGNLSSTNTTYTLKDELQDMRFFNRVLTAQEVKDYHNSFAKQPYLVEDFSDAPADGNAIVPRDWIKTSGTFKVGEISLASGELVTNGGFDTNTTWSKDAGITISDGTANFNTSGDGGLYKSITALVVGKTYRATYKIISITSGTLFFRLGVNEFIGTSRTSAGIYTETFTYRGIGAGTNRCEIRASGATTAVVDDFSIVEIDPLPTLTKGSKYLENVTAGLLTIPSQQAYGTWEFDMYKGSTSNDIGVAIMDTDTSSRSSPAGTQNSVWFLFYNDGRIYIQRAIAGSNSNLAYTTTDYLQNNTWYRVRITRTTAGSFTFLIKGGSLTPTAGYDGWTLISFSGGSGTNPLSYTTQTYSYVLKLDMDAGDRITNIKLTNGVQI